MSDEHTEDTNVVTLRPRSTQPTEAELSELDQVAGDAADMQVAELRPTTTLRTAVRGEQQPADAPLEHQLEALLFVSPTPLTTKQLAELTEQDEEDLHECLVDMMQAWGEGARGIVLERVAGGWAFRASDRCREQLSRLVRPQGDSRLSPSALETLAIVAYLQPVSRPDIAKIRGVSVDAAMTGLTERGLVEEAGRSESGAVLFRTTAHFERAFGLESLNTLPPIEGFGPGADELERMREQLEKMASARME
ncbi:MAG: chromosome segregation and condensation protein ScpB [Thermoleophilia bacterium]|nr:chromosome segregation and condensation protein ScpB [Thermoleophilia bacterium]